MYKLYYSYWWHDQFNIDFDPNRAKEYHNEALEEEMGEWAQNFRNNGAKDI